MLFTQQLMQMTRSGRCLIIRERIAYRELLKEFPHPGSRNLLVQRQRSFKIYSNEAASSPLAWKPTIICYKNCWVILWFEMSGFLGLRDDFKSMWEERNSRRKHFPLSLKLSSIEADVVTKEITRATHPWEMAKATWDVGGEVKKAHTSLMSLSATQGSKPR